MKEMQKKLKVSVINGFEKLTISINWGCLQQLKKRQPLKNPFVINFKWQKLQKCHLKFYVINCRIIEYEMILIIWERQFILLSFDKYVTTSWFCHLSLRLNLIQMYYLYIFFATISMLNWSTVYDVLWHDKTTLFYLLLCILIYIFYIILPVYCPNLFPLHQ